MHTQHDGCVQHGTGQRHKGRRRRERKGYDGSAICCKKMESMLLNQLIAPAARRLLPPLSPTSPAPAASRHIRMNRPPLPPSAPPCGR